MFLWDSIAFGPIHSRRLGHSLGINLLPTEKKICSFNCLYCECGWTLEKDVQLLDAYPLQTVLDAIEAKIKKCSEEHTPVDSITFSGNGEPTLYPYFSEVIEKLLLLRDKYYPNAVITCLSNSTQLYKKKVREALLKIENPILKLDAADEKLFKIINNPTVSVTARDVISWLDEMKGKFILQTLFFKGEVDGFFFNNGEGEALQQWLDVVQRLQPKMVMLYSLDRETPAKKIYKFLKEDLETIAERVRKLGIEAKVY